MKKTLFALALGALLLAAPRVASSGDVSVDFFYNNLSGGSWVDVDNYGYCWQPDVAVGNANWRPYSDGYWAYTDLGWTWVSYEDFGWATYHYGRWAMINDYGWMWVPGRDADLEWGPAWVSWRTGGDYIGWAPLPPETINVVEGRPLSGQLDVEFDIGPAYYNFVDVRYIGEPVLRERIVPSTQNITYIQQTVNVTNITYKNRTVYNYGPDINVINRTAARPIQRLRLDREQNVDFGVAAKTGGLTKVQGDRLVVAAPERITRSARQVAPPTVKTKVAAARIDRGWSAVGDERAQAEFKQRIKGQNLRNVPPPTGGAASGQANTAASATPAVGAAADTSSQGVQGRERDRRGQRIGAQGVAGASPSPAASPVFSASPRQGAPLQSRQGAGRGQGRQRNGFPQPTNQNAPPTSSGTPAEAGAGGGPGAAGDMTAGQGQNRGRRGQQHNAPTPAAGIDTTNPVEASGGAPDQSATTGSQGRRGGREQIQGNGAEGAGVGRGTQDRGEGRRFQNQPAETAPGDVQGPGGPRRQREGGEGVKQASPGQRAEGQGQGQKQGQGEGRRGSKKDQGEATPAATPPPQ